MLPALLGAASGVSVLLSAIVLSLTGVLGTAGQPPWWAVLVGVLNGVVAFWLLGRAAIAYLDRRLTTVFSQIRYRRLDDDHAGLLAGFARASQQAEDQARAAKEKERRAKVGARNMAD